VPRLRAEPLETQRLTLEPLAVAHAAELAPLLADARLYEHIGGEPPTRDDLHHRFARQSRGRSPDGQADWLNWVVRDRRSNEPLGTMQATVAAGTAHLAWLTGTAHQGQGTATEAAQAVVEDLRARGITRFAANIGRKNKASEALARRIGLSPTTEIHEGERVWRG
jgi:RimJ/RimL family protein N-acetyltransferase